MHYIIIIMNGMITISAEVTFHVLILLYSTHCGFIPYSVYGIRYRITLSHLQVLFATAKEHPVPRLF